MLLKFMGVLVVVSLVSRDSLDTASGPGAVITWRGECCIDSMPERKVELARALASEGTLRLDASELTRVDTAGLQLLAAWILELGQRGRVAHWAGASEALRESARIAGLSAVLGLEQAP